MALLEDIATERDHGLPSFLIYSAPGGGKSTLVLTFPAPGIVALDAAANVGKPLIEHGLAEFAGGKLRLKTKTVKIWDARRNEKGESMADTWPEARRGIDVFIQDPTVKTIVIDNLTFAWEDWVQADRGKNVDQGKTDFSAWDKFLSRCRQMKAKAADAGKLFVFLAHEAEDKNGFYRIPIPGQPGTILPADCTCVFRIVRTKRPGGKVARALLTRPTTSYYAKGFETMLAEEECADMRVVLDKIGLLSNYTQEDFAHCALFEGTYDTEFDPRRLRGLPVNKKTVTNQSKPTQPKPSQSKPFVNRPHTVGR